MTQKCVDYDAGKRLWTICTSQLRSRYGALGLLYEKMQSYSGIA